MSSIFTTKRQKYLHKRFNKLQKVVLGIPIETKKFESLKGSNF
jgi:hypothetical protein